MQRGAVVAADVGVHGGPEVFACQGEAHVAQAATGGGNVLATMCNFTIASEHAQFGQVGPKVGSVDPGFGTVYLARVVGEKRARAIWYLCRHPAVAEVAVVGFPDARLGERACAYVRLRDGASLSLAEPVAHLEAQKMASQYMPVRREIIGELPRTPSGKIQKFRLREMAREADGPA